MHVPAEDFLEHAVRAFGLAIRLRMVSSGHGQACAECAEHSLPELGREPWVTVGDEVAGETVETEDRIHEDPRTALCCDRLWYCSKMHHLAEAVHKDQNPVISMVVGWEPEHEIHGNGFPALCCHRQRLQWSVKAWRRLHALARLASTDVLADKLVLAQPVEVSAQREISFLTATMSTHWRIVVLEEDA